MFRKGKVMNDHVYHRHINCSSNGKTLWWAGSGEVVCVSRVGFGPPHMVYNSADHPAHVRAVSPTSFQGLESWLRG